MAQYHILHEVRTFQPGQWQLCFQYGVYAYDPEVTGARGKLEFGYRFIWRRPNGQLQGARGQARLEPHLMAILFGKAAAEGWYPTPPDPGVRTVTIATRSWRVSVQRPVAVRAVADGDARVQLQSGSLVFVSDSDRYEVPLDELPSDPEFALVSRDQFQVWLARARGSVALDGHEQKRADLLDYARQQFRTADAVQLVSQDAYDPELVQGVLQFKFSGARVLSGITRELWDHTKNFAELRAHMERHDWRETIDHANVGLPAKTLGENGWIENAAWK